MSLVFWVTDLDNVLPLNPHLEMLKDLCNNIHIDASKEELLFGIESP